MTCSLQGKIAASKEMAPLEATEKKPCLSSNMVDVRFLHHDAGRYAK
jgi:hypothetical protein